MNSTYLWWFGLFGNVHPTVMASSKQIHAVQQTEGGKCLWLLALGLHESWCFRTCSKRKKKKKSFS